MRKNYLIVYGIVILLISFFICILNALGGHRLSMSNPWLYFSTINFFSAILVFLSSIIVKTKIWDWIYFKKYYLVLLVGYILVTINSLVNISIHVNATLFDYAVASIIVILTILAIMCVLLKRKTTTANKPAASNAGIVG